MEKLKKQPEIIEEFTVKDSFKAVHYHSGIVEIIWSESLEIVDVKQLEEIREVLFKLGGGKKMPIYFSTRDFLHISAEARKSASTIEGARYTLANAVLIDKLAKKLIFNFFLRVNKPNTPTKGFSNKEDAFEWLKSLIKK